MKFPEPQLKYSKTFPAVSKLEPQRSVLIFDEILFKKPHLREWIEQFPFCYSISSGESLKDLKAFPEHMERILSLSEKIPQRPLQVICLGGGSVGDFAGFVASVIKRGVDFVQIPSTWLAAIDSAHGGKNALNVGSIKNQVGTFHFPQKIFLIEELLSSQPAERTEDALGEAVKISLIEGGDLWKKWERVRVWDAKTLWKLLPDFIEAKYKVVRRDPFEKKGLRHVLNLGHTVGHAIEAELKISHGKSVLAGLGFALEWSREKGLLKTKNFPKLPDQEDYREMLRKLKNPDQFLKQDKKRVGSGKVRFIFLQRPGKTVVQSVTVDEILNEIQRQSQS